MFNLMQADCTGYGEIHTSQLSKTEADEMLRHYRETFPSEQFWLEQCEQPEPERERHYNEKAVDGWEDIYSH